MIAKQTPTTEKRAAPRQGRSVRTVELILLTASQMLSELGFEKLSTNGICARAGLTPPALYRYFPNKYAVLKALGERLMTRQNQVLEDWSEKPFKIDTVEMDVRHLLKQTLLITRQEPAGGWIMRSLRASPVLTQVRLDSHRDMSNLLTGRILTEYPGLAHADVYHHMRLVIEIGYAVIEMLHDEEGMKEEMILTSTALLLAESIYAAIGK